MDNATINLLKRAGFKFALVSFDDLSERAVIYKDGAKQARGVEFDILNPKGEYATEEEVFKALHGYKINHNVKKKSRHK